MVRAAGLEPARASRPNGFSSHFGFRRRHLAFVVWTIPSPWRRRFRCCPSSLSAATLDEKFFHPRFLLMDNVEDKGMEDERSHNFQKLIIARPEAAAFEHQIIFTTSTIAPELDISAYTIGPSYDHDHKTLDIL